MWLHQLETTEIAFFLIAIILANNPKSAVVTEVLIALFTAAVQVATAGRVFRTGQLSSLQVTVLPPVGQSNQVQVT